MPTKNTSTSLSFSALQDLYAHLQAWALELGFNALGVADLELQEHQQHLERWLEQGYHGDMGYMAKHGSLRSEPANLVAGTLRVISLRMDYWPELDTQPSTALDDPIDAYISRYALGRDYHKMMRKRLAKLADRLSDYVVDSQYRVFVDSAPVLEKALAEKAGIGWIGKHSNVINPKSGSYFFLGEIFTNIPFAINPTVSANHCGQCSACITHCPTQAIVAPYQVDARRCISYLTIEHFGAIDPALRPLMGNRIYGCDDCQLACPWNRFASQTVETDFLPRHGLDQAALIELFAWDEAMFSARTQGSAIARIGYTRWLRNIAIALGNSPRSAANKSALRARLSHPSALVREHVLWALNQPYHA